MRDLKRIIPPIAVLFLGYLGFSLVLPIFPPLFLNPEYPLFDPDTSEKVRRIAIGIFFTLYPIGQFFGAPILGKYSDKYGRKPILLLSLLITIPLYILSAISLAHNWLLPLCIARILSGIFEGNIVIAQAAVSDISKNIDKKIENFSWLTTLGSSAFFFGPLISGILTNRNIASWFRYETPFWAIAFFSSVGFFIVYFFYRETHEPVEETDTAWKSIALSCIEGFRNKNLQTIFLINGSIYLALFFFLNFMGPYLVNILQFDTTQLGIAESYLTLFLMSAPFLFRKLARYWNAKKILATSALLLAQSYLLFLLFPKTLALIGTLVPIGLFTATGFMFPVVLVADRAEKRAQGEALGTNTSIQVLSESGASILGGLFLAMDNRAPIVVGALCAIVGGILLIHFYFSGKSH